VRADHVDSITDARGILEIGEVGTDIEGYCEIELVGGLGVCTALEDPDALVAIAEIGEVVEVDRDGGGTVTDLTVRAGRGVEMDRAVDRGVGDGRVGMVARRLGSIGEMSSATGEHHEQDAHGRWQCTRLARIVGCGAAGLEARV
jgi:hypothetical protein